MVNMSLTYAFRTSNSAYIMYKLKEVEYVIFDLLALTAGRKKYLTKSLGYILCNKFINHVWCHAALVVREDKLA